ncbi:MAG: hypothetical protein OIF51_15990 [Cellvibrionaceae bacterium]|nr:hypothetical protein [Cellvibrionaceae bacterium]
MDLIVGIVIILMILGALLFFLPLSIVKLTEWENDESHPVYITKRYINKIGWYNAQHQQLSIFYGWVALLLLAGKGGSIDVNELAILCAIAIAAGYWFFRSFKGLFTLSTNWHDNSKLMSSVLLLVLVLHAAIIISFFFAMVIGGIVSIWWGGRLMMYKALREQNG